MANLSAIKLPNGTTYNLKDNGALQLTGGQVTGPVTFGDSVSIDEATIGDLVVNGSASFTNNIQVNTINGVAVGNSPKFTDTNTEVSTLTLASGNTAGTILAYGGKYTLTAGSKTVSFTMPSADDTNTWRTIQVNGTDILGSGTGTGKLNLKAGTGITVTNSSGTVTIASTITDTNTHRPIQMNGTEILGNNTTALNLKAGTNVSLSNSSGTVTISATDTTYESKAAASGGTTVSLVTTGEKYTWNSKTSNTGTVTSVAASGSGGISISGSPITTSGTITIGLNLSTAINGLGEGTSAAQRNDYAVVQYAGGGTTTTTYHRRKLSNIFAALNKSDITTALGYTPPTSDTNTWRGIQDNLTSTSTTESLSANQGRLLKNTKAEYRSIGSCADYQRVVIGLCELSTNASSGTSSHTSGSIVSIRSNGLVPEYVSQFVFQDDYSTAKACNYSFIGNFENTNTTLRAGEGFKACTFTYNSKYYAGLEFYQTQARSFYWYGEGNFEPFLVAYYNFHTSTVLNTEINNSISLSTSVLKRRNITTDVSKVANSVAWSGVTDKPTTTGSKATGITASTTATKTTLGTAFTIPNITSAGSASTWAFEEISVPNVTAAGSASSWTFEEKTIPNVTSAGSASTWAFTGVTVANSISGAVDANDSTQLNITVGTTTVQSKSSGGNGTAPTLGTAIKVQSKSGGSNGSAPTLGTAIKIQSKKSGGNGTAPTLGTAFTVPNVTGNTSATVSITDPGHTHSI